MKSESWGVYEKGSAYEKTIYKLETFNPNEGAHMASLPVTGFLKPFTLGKHGGLLLFTMYNLEILFLGLQP